MLYTTATTIAGESAGNPETVSFWALNAGARRPADVHLYLTEVYRLCAIAHLRAEIVVAQAIHECSDAQTGAPFASSWWVDRCNPAGIGITGDPAQDDASRDFGNGTNAARAHVVHLFLYAVGDTLPSGMDPAWDPRWAIAISKGRAGVAPTIQGLQNTWGMDNNYANALLGRLIALSKVMGTSTGGGSVATLNMTKGLIPLPKYTKSIVDVSQRDQGIDCRGYDDLGQRTVKGLVLHRSQGTYVGNDNYFHATCCPALTDWQVDPGSGALMLFNNPENRISGWANGRVIAPWGDGPPFINKYGIDGVNRDETAIEIAGWYDDPVSPAAWETIAQWIAHFAHDRGITYDQFPVYPPDGFSFVRWHQEFTGPDEKICPGPVVMQGTDACFARVVAILEAAQTSGTPAPAPTPTPSPVKYVTPSPVPGLPNLATLDADAALPDYQDSEGQNYETVFDIYEATVDTHRYGRASGNQADWINDPFRKGGRVVIAVRFDSGATKDKWGLSRESTRFWLKDFKRVSDASVLS